MVEATVREIGRPRGVTVGTRVAEDTEARVAAVEVAKAAVKAVATMAGV